MVVENSDKERRERLLGRLLVIILWDWLNLLMTVVLFFMDVNPWGYHAKPREVIIFACRFEILKNG